MTIRVGIIGASFAREAYLPALRTIDDVELVAIASARIESARSAAREYAIPHAYDDWERLLGEHEFDLVCIATPTVFHAPMTLAALKAGAHALCEKPMALNSDESAAMLETAEALELLHIIGHELRFNPNRRKIKSLLDSGAIGQLRHLNIQSVSATWGDPASRPAGDWWSREETGGGRLGASGSHLIDLLRFWLGDIGAISGQVATMVPQRVDREGGAPWLATADDQFSFTAEMRSGALCSVFVSGAGRHASGTQTQIYGSEGTIMLADSDEKLLVARADEDFEDMSLRDRNADLPGIGPGIWNVSFVALMEELTAAIREGRPLAWGASFADGHQCQLAMDALRQSSRERRWISL
ncbi:MAG: Gfo/Idh/MocA family oxidoreductase [Chloroflexota bacterium]|nr:Gfo/Idh/MocA family oxidoreductase [Chloroflexota bacterium]MDE2946708.1 Gfo/Idh/MocA family oxidoreductase [Chloroflexota bacterium]